MLPKEFVIQTGEIKSFDDYNADYYVLFFYPKDDTPG